MHIGVRNLYETHLEDLYEVHEIGRTVLSTLVAVRFKRIFHSDVGN